MTRGLQEPLVIIILLILLLLSLFPLGAMGQYLVIQYPWQLYRT